MTSSMVMLMTAALFGGSAQAKPEPAAVGVFDEQAIVVAFYRSERWGAAIREKRAEQRKAKEAGDTAKVAELEKWGAEQQELAHRQLEGKAPIDNILANLAPDLPAVAAQAGVAKIVPKAPKGARTVDVTPAMLDLLKADERTRRVVEELREKRPGSR